MGALYHLTADGSGMQWRSPALAWSPAWKQGCAAAKPLAALAGKVRLAVAGKFPIIPKGYSGLVEPLLAGWMIGIGGIMGNYGELWGIVGNYGGIMGNLGGIMGNYGELWGIMGNYGELWGIMGNNGELWAIMGNYGELWGIMGNYGMSFLVLLIVVFCRRMAPCFHRHVRLSSSQQCSLCATRLPIQGPQGIHFPGAAGKANEEIEY